MEACCSREEVIIVVRGGVGGGRNSAVIGFSRGMSSGTFVFGIIL